MCLAVPSRVVEVLGQSATVVAFGRRREVSLMLLEEGTVAVGDYLLIQAGGLAFERLAPAQAEESLALMGSLLDHGGDARAWGTA